MVRVEVDVTREGDARPSPYDTRLTLRTRFFSGDIYRGYRGYIQGIYRRWNLCRAQIPFFDPWTYAIASEMHSYRISL